MQIASSAGYRTRISVRLLIVLLGTGLALLGLSLGFPVAGGDRASASMSTGQQVLTQGTDGNTAPDLGRGSRIPWQDGSYFLAGVNYPQYQYYGGDIGTS